MRIAVVVVFGKQQNAALAHEINNLRVRFEDAHTGEVFHLRREVSGVINWTIDLQAIPLSDHKVVVAVARRRVHRARAGFASRLSVPRFADVQFSFRISFAAQRYMVADHQQ